jgi:uncharacterized membrane protein YgcG
MKKKFFNAVSTLAIAAIVALNVHVVTSEQTPAFLKWDVIGKIFADGTSGSGSGSGCHSYCELKSKSDGSYGGGSASQDIECSACCGMGQRAKCNTGVLGVGRGCKCS